MGAIMAAQLFALAGESLPLTDWSRRTGVPVRTIRARLARGWSLDRALAEPPDKKHSKGGRRKGGGVRPVPPMRHRPDDGRAYARWKANGATHQQTFGLWGSAEAVSAYSRFRAEWAAGITLITGTALTVSEMCVAWLDWAATEFRKGGKLTSEYHKCTRAAKAVSDLYGPAPAREFTPAAFRAVRAVMLASDLSRVTIGQYVYRVYRAFSWAAGRSLVPATVADALAHVESLKPGRTAAREPSPRREVEPERVAAVLLHLSPKPGRNALLGAMVRFQQLTGARPNEVCSLRPCDLDRSGAVWCYTVRDDANKTHDRGKARRVWIGPQAQEVLRPYLAGAAADRVFPVARYWYCACIGRACKKAGVEKWTPHQLRHAHATRIARATGSAQSAADAIGDTVATASKHYIHCDPREEARAKLAADHG